VNFDIAVIGKGLIGSAAAAYLARQSTASIVLIGPDEPAEGSETQEALVYASHYDAGRVQRIIGKDPTWTRLNLESVQAYPTLEKETSIRFHQPVGCLYVSPHGSDEYLDRLDEDCAHFGLTYTRFPDAGAITAALPEYAFPSHLAGSVGMLERGMAGLIQPRRLIEAQLARFRSLGGQTLSHVVTSRESSPESHRLILSDGSILNATKVLVAAGSFVNFHNLLPRPLAITLKGETILLAEVSEAEALRLATLPTLLYELFQDDLDGIYLIGPLQYPDGRWYIKMGCNLIEDQYFTTLEEVQAWFRTPDANLETASLPRLVAAVRAILPGVEFIGFHIRRCIIHRTPSLRQYIGQGGAPGLYVVAGCNGYSAMCSDALGRVAAHFVLNQEYSSGYSADLFQPQFAY
jgi:sarcosine oxidase